MSAAAEPARTGSNAATGDDSRLDLPNDAVAMKSMPQPSPSSPDHPISDAAAVPVNDATDSSPSSSNPDPTVVTSNPEQDEASAVVSKGKEKEDVKEDAPPPPAKEDADEQQEAIMAIGPAQDDIRAAAHNGPEGGAVCNITLLLTSGGRHPYRIDAKYLSRRNVAMPEEDDNGQPDPFSISIYTLKELILREWRADWETKPASPSSIRLIHFGKLLDDKEPLRKYQFSTESPNVVHMSIRPQDLDEEEPKTGSKSLPTGGSDGEGRRNGRCCVIL